MPEARILFVEDDIGKRYVIARQLRMHGFTVDEAGTGAEGLAQLTPDHDVAVIDMKLPDMHGSELCRRIKSTSTAMVLELSATFGTPEDRARGLELGADAYLVHPVETIELVASIRALVRLRKSEIDRERQRQLLFAMISHDLRNPLQTIVMASHLLRSSKTIEAESDKRAIGALVRESERMSRLVEQLLIFTKNASSSAPATRTLVDIGPIVSRVIASQRRANDIVFDDKFGGEAMLDGDRIEQMLDNLITNALRYGTAPINVSARSVGGQLEISVHNGGNPIPPDALPTLFDPYRRAASSHKGVGLGLYIVRQIVDAHDGTVEVRSTAEEGTTFTVRLPTSAPA